jgi:hypothetical protein
MRAKHTPGPWIANIEVRWPTQIGCCPLVGNPYSIHHGHRNVAAANTAADALLIAAAPELLEALKWMVANDDTNEGDEPVESLGGHSWNEYNSYWLDGLNKARAAIAKATGEK